MADEELETVDATDVAETKVDATEKTEPTPAEDRARRMGWRPKDEFDRDPSKWVNADEFIRRGEAELPVLKERIRKMDGQLAEGNKLLRDLVSRQKEDRDTAVKGAIEKLKAERVEAVANGDAAKVEALSDQIVERKESLKEPVAAEQPGYQVPQEVIAWTEANPWFNANAKMRAVATAEYGELMGDKSLSETGRLAKVKAEVMRRFPENFANGKRTAPAAVEGGNGGARRETGKSWSDIPAPDREIAQRLIKQGAVKDQAAYAKSYFGS